MTILEGDYRTPGQLIKALLEERGWSQRVLAVVLGVERSSITRLVSDRRPVDAQMALALGEIFSVPAERFLEIQHSFDLAKARLVARPDPARAIRARLFGDLPVAEMITRGWLDAEDMEDVPQVEKALAKFFRVPSANEIETLPHAAKKTNVGEDVTPVQLCWLYRVREIASEMIVPRYTPAAGRNAVEKLSALLSAPEEARRAPRILAESGIRFLVVESLSSAKIDGVCFWLNEAAPVIGLTMRFDRMDNFWFVLRHELEHVLRGHGKEAPALDTELDREKAGTGPDVGEEEGVANKAAADFCVPADKLKRFIARKSPIFAERDILGFAKTLGVHPSLVAGQLQHHTGRYDRFRSHIVKIRSAVTPSAVVDGWGDVAPTGT